MKIYMTNEKIKGFNVKPGMIGFTDGENEYILTYLSNQRDWFTAYKYIGCNKWEKIDPFINSWILDSDDIAKIWFKYHNISREYGVYNINKNKRRKQKILSLIESAYPWIHDFSPQYLKEAFDAFNGVSSNNIPNVYIYSKKFYSHLAIDSSKSSNGGDYYEYTLVYFCGKFCVLRRITSCDFVEQEDPEIYMMKSMNKILPKLIQMDNQAWEEYYEKIAEE